jgi:hypothetical protein
LLSNLGQRSYPSKKKSGFGLLFTEYVQQKIAKVLLIKKILKSKLKKSQITTLQHLLLYHPKYVQIVTLPHNPGIL